MADFAAASDAAQDAIDFILVLMSKVAPSYISLHGTTMPSFKVGFYKQTAQELAAQEPVIAALVAAGRERGGVYSATMQAVAKVALQPPDAVQHALQRLAGAGHVHLEAGREQAIAVSVRDEAPAGLAKDVHMRLQRLQQLSVRPMKYIGQALCSRCGWQDGTSRHLLSCTAAISCAVA